MYHDYCPKTVVIICPQKLTHFCMLSVFYCADFFYRKVNVKCVLLLKSFYLDNKIYCNFNIFFCRPPGHHAMSNEFNGYCYLNNVATAAKLAIKNHGLKR